MCRSWALDQRPSDSFVVSCPVDIGAVEGDAGCGTFAWGHTLDPLLFLVFGVFGRPRRGHPAKPVTTEALTPIDQTGVDAKAVIFQSVQVCPFGF